MWLLTLWFWLGNQALPDYLWAFGRQTERPTRVAHRAGRAFVASDARPTPWTTLHCLQRLPWHSESRCDKGNPVLDLRVAVLIGKNGPHKPPEPARHPQILRTKRFLSP